jgi:hypothetical protein
MKKPVLAVLSALVWSCSAFAAGEFKLFDISLGRPAPYPECPSVKVPSDLHAYDREAPVSKPCFRWQSDTEIGKPLTETGLVTIHWPEQQMPPPGSPDLHAGTLSLTFIKGKVAHFRASTGGWRLQDRDLQLLIDVAGTPNEVGTIRKKIWTGTEIIEKDTIEALWELPEGGVMTYESYTSTLSNHAVVGGIEMMSGYVRNIVAKARDEVYPNRIGSFRRLKPAAKEPIPRHE